jgi:hypothetical protein
LTNYNPDMNTAPKEAESLLFVVPTGSQENPLIVEFGRWDDDDQRWGGEWRHADTPYATHDPIAWAPVPEIDVDLYAGLSANGDAEAGADPVAETSVA